MSHEPRLTPHVPTPLLLPAIFWLAGIILSYLFFSELLITHFFTVIIPVTAAIALSYLLFRNKPASLSILLLVMATGFLRTTVSQHRPPDNVSYLFEDGTELIQTVRIRIDSSPRLHKGAFRDYYRLTGTVSQIAGTNVSGRAVVRFPENYLISGEAKMLRGDYIEAVGVITPYRRTAGFSRIPAYYFRNNRTPDIMVVPVTLVETLPGDLSFPLKIRRSIEKVRLEMIERIDARLPERHTNFIKAVLLGERADMQEEREILAKAGLAHLLAISGLHLAIITLAILTLLSVVGIRRTPAHLITILLIVSYAELCGWTPSVSRASLMIVLYLITGILQRKSSPNNILLASLIIITAVNPAQLFSIGLQFSFISVFVIINLYSPVKQYTDRLRRERMMTGIGVLFWSGVRSSLNIVLLTLLITLFLAPAILYYFSYLSFNGIIANLLGIPLISLIIPLALLLIIIPAPAVIIGIYQNALSLLLDLLNNWTALSASLPFYFNFIPFSFLQVIAAYLFLIILAGKSIKVVERWNGRDRTLSTVHRSLFTVSPLDPHVSRFTSHVSRFTSHTSSLSSYILLAVLLIFVIAPSLFRKSDLLKVTMFNAGHGDIFLIETPYSETILIDTGPPEIFAGHFRNSALAYFQQNGIRGVDRIILTHPHNDHYGGFPWITQNLYVGEVILTNQFKKSALWQQINRNISPDTNIIAVRDTTSVPGLSLPNKIIHPDRDYSSDNVNNMSIVMRVRFNNFSMLFTGDIEEDAETYLVSKYSPYLQSTFLKVAHHGSRTSSTGLFLKEVEPEYALIPSSIGGRHNLPHSEVLDRLLSCLPGKNIFISGKDGAVHIKTDGITAVIKTTDSNRKKLVNF